MKRQTAETWNCHEVTDLLRSGEPPEEGYPALLHEANNRIAMLHVTIRNMKNEAALLQSHAKHPAEFEPLLRMLRNYAEAVLPQK